jgi:hypothetical protein
MEHRFIIRSLGSLPWPHGLGKYEDLGHPYNQLEHQLRAYFGDDRSFAVATHEQAYRTGDPEYRRIVLHALNQMPWSAGLLDDVEVATALSRAAPLLNQPLKKDEEWIDWARPHCGAVSLSNAWLINPLCIDDQWIVDGRHRLTYLRFHRPPEHQILVRQITLNDLGDEPLRCAHTPAPSAECNRLSRGSQR